MAGTLIKCINSQQYIIKFPPIGLDCCNDWLVDKYWSGYNGRPSSSVAPTRLRGARDPEPSPPPMAAARQGYRSRHDFNEVLCLSILAMFISNIFKCTNIFYIRQHELFHAKTFIYKISTDCHRLRRWRAYDGAVTIADRSKLWHEIFNTYLNVTCFLFRHICKWCIVKKHECNFIFAFLY